VKGQKGVLEKGGLRPENNNYYKRWGRKGVRALSEAKTPKGGPYGPRTIFVREERQRTVVLQGKTETPRGKGVPEWGNSFIYPVELMEKGDHS